MGFSSLQILWRINSCLVCVCVWSSIFVIQFRTQRASHKFWSLQSFTGAAGIQWSRATSTHLWRCRREFLFFQMEVSWNRGTPKSSILIGFSHIIQLLGHPIYGNPQMVRSWKVFVQRNSGGTSLASSSTIFVECSWWGGPDWPYHKRIFHTSPSNMWEESLYSGLPGCLMIPDILSIRSFYGWFPFSKKHHNHIPVIMAPYIPVVTGQHLQNFSFS